MRIHQSPFLISAIGITLLGSAAHAGNDAANHINHGHINHGAAGHAPIGVMGDHTHRAGEFMLSYRYMRMEMNGNRDGTDSVSTQQVLDDFVVTPLEMTTQMHMLGGMYAFSDDITVMLMVPYVEKEMDHRTRTDVEFTTEGSGIGDVKAGMLFGLMETTRSMLHGNLSISAPTGSIDERDDNPRCQMMGNCPSRLPYPMQIGSGTWDVMLGLTERVRYGKWSAGGQANATLRIGRNDQGYSLGDQFDLSFWGAREIGTAVSGSLRIAYRWWDDIDGNDDELRNLPAGFIPTARTDLRGGQRADAGLGINVALGGGHRIAAEYLYPAWQDLDGPQLESDGMFTLGYQFTR